MDRIIEHIERLLLRHDCVIIPDFGGFVLQSASAVYMKEEHSFTPVRKEIVFNPTLTHNDGLLTESYMQNYSLGFDKAQQLVRKDVAGMKNVLAGKSELQLGSIGVIAMENERLVFMPAKSSDVLFSTRSYGLPVFHYLPLSARNIVTAVAAMVKTGSESDLSSKKTEKRNKNIIYNIPVTRTFLRAMTATAAAIFLFLLISTPVSDVNRDLYSASFVPQEIMPKKTVDEIVSDAFSATDDANVGAEPVNAEAKTVNVEPIPDAAEKPAELSPTKPSSATSSAKGASANSGAAKYYVIIGSFKSKAQAQVYIKQLKGTDLANTVDILMSDGRARIYAQSFSTESSAQAYMNKIRKDPRHTQAWVYKAP